jgi:hypothetical protein
MRPQHDSGTLDGQGASEVRMTEVTMGISTTIESSWSPHAMEVLTRACEYHGGLAKWRALRNIRLIPERLTGLLPWLKGVGKTFFLPSSFEISPHQRTTRFVGFPDPEHVGVFQNGAVRIERLSDASVVARSEDHRRSFDWPARARRWGPLDALYFFGYALAHYHSLPFSLLQSRLVRASAQGSAGNRVSVLELDLPDDLHTHCRRQRFYFDARGKILRHDYHAEVAGFLARGAHFWNRQARFAGFPIALERHVVARLASTPCPITALHATFADAEVTLDPSNISA